jgi:hypothetical protein
MSTTIGRRELLLAPAFLCAAQAAVSESQPAEKLKANRCRLAVRAWHCREGQERESARAALDVGGQSSRLLGNTWQIVCTASAVKERSDAVDLEVRFRLAEGSADDAAVSLELEFDGWSRSNYVLMPGAVYNGNRFRTRRGSYPPFLDAADRRPDLPLTLTDVPHLKTEAGPSLLEEFTGEVATPAVGFYSPAEHKAFWLLTEQRNVRGNLGLFVEESEDRSSAIIRVMTPSVRKQRAGIAGRVPSLERGQSWRQGDEITLRLRLHFFPAPSLQALFRRFVEIRKDLMFPGTARQRLPFSAAWSMLEDKFNAQNWREEYGWYGVGPRTADEVVYNNWQLGWVGGCMTTQALLFAGSEESRRRAWRNLDTILTRSQAGSGFFWGMSDGRRWYSDEFSNPDSRLVLTRKVADALYFFFKQFDLLKKQGQSVPERWEKAAARQADALVKLWKRYGQFGQFVDVETGELVIGATTSAAAAPAALALASRYFHQSEYLETAQAAASLFHARDVDMGITNGGPGDALQAPDSESAGALLESFVVLYETTRDRKWLQAAEEMARQFSTWVVAYDYAFPSASTFARMGMQTTGAVWANVQNRHAGPAICTSSGEALLRLFRATGNRFYLDLLRDIAHGIPQYLSCPKRPIPGKTETGMKDLENGWICERVQMGDWESPELPIGEVFWGSTWAETSLMLTWIEVPGLYVQPDTGLVCAIDHIDARRVSAGNGHVEIELTNPTSYAARVRTLVETSTAAGQPLGLNALLDCPVIALAPGESRKARF